MKLKNLPPFKVGDKVTWLAPVYRTKMIVLAVHRHPYEEEWEVTLRYAGLSGWLDHKLYGMKFTEPARYFRRVK